MKLLSTTDSSVLLGALLALTTLAERFADYFIQNFDTHIFSYFMSLGFSAAQNAERR